MYVDNIACAAACGNRIFSLKGVANARAQAATETSAEVFVLSQNTVYFDQSWFNDPSPSDAFFTAKGYTIDFEGAVRNVI